MSFGDGNLHETVGRLRNLVLALAEILALYRELPEWVADEMRELGVSRDG